MITLLQKLHHTDVYIYWHIYFMSTTTSQALGNHDKIDHSTHSHINTLLLHMKTYMCTRVYITPRNKSSREINMKIKTSSHKMVVSQIRDFFSIISLLSYLNRSSQTARDGTTGSECVPTIPFHYTFVQLNNTQIWQLVVGTSQGFAETAHAVLIPNTQLSISTCHATRK